MSDAIEIRAGRRTVELKRPDKTLFPAAPHTRGAAAGGAAITKRDVAEYYLAVAPAMVPHVRDRPLNLDRYPDGIGKRGLFTQAAPGHFPAWIPRATVAKKGGTVPHAVVNEPATLVYLAGQAAIALHAWTSRADMLDRPDRLIIDFDPQVEDVSAIRRAALQAGELYRACGLEPFAMVTGSRGIHVVAPLKRTSVYEQVNAVARAMARRLAGEHPDELTTEFRIANRGDRIYVDAGRARYGHTGVAPYSLRARPGAPVAMPIRWEELEDEALRPDGFTLRDVPARLEREGDAWKDIARSARGLGEARRALRVR
jgi:bifunctional non-homologous end joining protein LigD